MKWLFEDRVQVWGLNSQLHLRQYEIKKSKNPGDAGVDLYPYSISKTETVPGWTRFTISTGIHMHFPGSVFGRIIHRSSSFMKLNGGLVQDGTIDSGYIGELFVIVHALQEHRGMVTAGIERCINTNVALAQIIMSPFKKPVFECREVFNTGRGKDGFGSTDVLK